MTSSGWSFSAVYFWIPKIAILFKCILIFFPPLYILILRRNIQEINNITHSQKEYKSHLMSFWNDIRCCTGKHFSQYILRKWSKLSMSFWMIVMSLLVWNLKEIICRENVSSYFVHFWIMWELTIMISQVYLWKMNIYPFISWISKSCINYSLHHYLLLGTKFQKVSPMVCACQKRITNGFQIRHKDVIG